MDITVSDRSTDCDASVLATTPTDGHGMIAMRERAALFGGTLRAERLPTGFQVTATLPTSRSQDPDPCCHADDQPMMRAGFKAVLESAGEIEVIAEADNGEQAVRAATEHLPDVVLMDIRMPIMDGIEATRQLPRQRVLILTTFGLDQYIIEALRAGASGFLLKDAPTRDVIAAVKAVAAGDAVLSAAVTRQLLNQVARRLPAAVLQQPEQLRLLTEREHEVLRMLAGGLSNGEIAAAMVVSEATVKSHVSHVLGKLGLRDRVQAVIYAYETRLITPSDD